MASKNQNKQYVVVGLGRFGSAIAQTLCESGAEVLGIDSDMSMVEDMKDLITHAVQLDAMDRSAMEALGVSEFDAAFVTMGSDIRASGTITLMLKELGVKLVIAKAHDEFHGRMLEKLGADKVLFPERDMGRRIAHNIVTGNVIDFLELSQDYSLAEIVPKREWLGKPLRELDLRGRAKTNIVVIKHSDDTILLPDPDTVIAADDVLLVVAGENTLRTLNRRR